MSEVNSDNNSNRVNTAPKTNIMVNDSPSLQISPIKLDGQNYLAWSRSCLLFIKARGLYDYITGRQKRPPEEDSASSQWESENSLIMPRLLNSMQPAIARGLLFFDSAYKIWTAVAQTYSKTGYDALVYELRKKLHETKQGDATVAQYFQELSSLWQELDYYQDFQAKCPDDAAIFQKLIEKERVYDFLAGLQANFDPIRVQVLGRDPFPSLREAYAYVQQEESRRNVMFKDLSALARGRAENLSARYGTVRAELCR